MKRNIRQCLIVAATALSFAACDVKDPIYNTPHPEQGAITLVTDWSGIGEGLTAPASYTVEAGDYSAILIGTTNLLEPLFEPGSYHLHVYNTPQHITMSGSVATVAGASGNVDGAGPFVQEMPGWLFTGVTETMIEADTDHTLTVAMQQQVRQLTLFIEPTGSTTDRIERIEGYLSGVASTLDMDNGTHGTPLNVALAFAKVTEGANAGNGRPRCACSAWRVCSRSWMPNSTLQETVQSRSLSTVTSPRSLPPSTPTSISHSPWAGK